MPQSGYQSVTKIRRPVKWNFQESIMMGRFTVTGFIRMYIYNRKLVPGGRYTKSEETIPGSAGLRSETRKQVAGEVGGNRKWIAAESLVSGSWGTQLGVE